MTARSVALVSTDRPARYGKQLVSHLGRRNGGEWSDEDSTGHIVLAAGTVRLSCAEAGLSLSITGDADKFDTMEDVVARHLERFGTRDELHVVWERTQD